MSALPRATMPAIFFGHGNPMNAIESNAFTRSWRTIGQSMPRPKAVLAISAHWYLPRTSVTTGGEPRTIHDFGGFPRELYRVRYPAPGSADLERRVIEVLAPDVSVTRDESWGLDHGTWSVLRHVFPEADVPVVQLSIDETKPLAFHYEVGQKLRGLRDEGFLIMGSGNVVHNLRAYAWGDRGRGPYDWTVRFERQVRELIARGEHGAIVEYEKLGPDALLAVPTPEHFLPLLYILGASKPGESATFPVEGVDGAAASMMAVAYP